VDDREQFSSGAIPLNEIHASALVHPEAKIGRGVRIGAYSIIGPDVEIGEGSEIGSHVVIENRVRMGRDNQIFHGSVIGSTPQDLKYAGADSRVELGDRNTVREYVTINIATAEGEVTRIGNDCLLMAYSHVAHNCELANNIVLANSVNLAGHVRVDDFVVMGGMSAVHQFVLLGAHSFIGGLTGVRLDVPPYVKVAGNPPRPMGINSVGLERRGFAAQELQRVKSAYRYIYRRGLRREEALAEIMSEGEDTIARCFADFFERSERGLVR
jgi:UDP-N-acetylglucosamine acyltransferase